MKGHWPEGERGGGGVGNGRRGPAGGRDRVFVFFFRYGVGKNGAGKQTKKKKLV